MPRGYAPSFPGGPLAALLGRNPELSRYQTPIGGLFLTGAATFPGAVTVVWNADTGEQILQVADLTEPRFSPDGTRLAGVSGDGNFISVYAV